MEKTLQYAKDLVYQAGYKIKEMMKHDLNIQSKGVADFVTDVDKSVESFIVEGIQKRYEDHAFLTEEKTVDMIESDHMWIVDPIDGTTNFIYQKENFSISLAYYFQEKPVFGIVYDVMNDVMYWGMIGLGAYRNEVPLKSLNQDVLLSDSVISGDVYRPNFFKLSPEDLKPLFIANRFLGSGALETAMVAGNRFNAYVFPKINLWDIAAAVILLQCVGGSWLFGDLRNQVSFDDESKVFIAASNDKILNALVELL